jgi:hypothetical protein
MFVRQRQLAERANAELLQQTEESLVRSQEVIAEINEFLAQRHAERELYRVSHG